MKCSIYQANIYRDTYDQRIGTSISAYIENGLLAIVQVDWGGITYEYSRDGEVERYLLFDLENTNKLAKSLQARQDEAFVCKLAERFGRYKSLAKHEICKYCDKREIRYKTHVYY